MENRACTQLFRDAVLAAGDHDLTRRYAVEHKVLTAAVKLAEHVVEQQHRLLAVLVEEQLPLGEFKRQCAGPHLSLRAEGSGTAAIQ